MNVQKKCCYRSLKENRKRTAVTMVGVILATALITAVACMAESFRVSMIAYEKEEKGDFHFLFSGVPSEKLKFFENNRNVERIGLAEELGYAVLEDSRNEDKPYLYIRGIDENGSKAMALHLTEGRMPQNGGELVIGRHIRSNGGVDLKVGDVLELQVGSRMWEGYSLNQGNPYHAGEEMFEPAFEKTYTVVGIVERPGLLTEEYSAPGYSVFTCLENVESAGLEVYVSYTRRALKDYDRVTAGLLGLPEDGYREAVQRGESSVARDVQENREVLRWELMRFSDTNMNMIYGMTAVAILIIVISAVFCIRNSFVISLTEKLKLYGRLASVGTTSRQLKKIVYYEAGFLAVTGIPIGILSGILAVVVVVQVAGGLLKEGVGFALVPDLSVPSIIFAVLIALLTVYLSAHGSAGKAGRISPMTAIRANNTIKVSSRELRCPALIRKLFGTGGKLAYRNLQRARVKYRTTVVSLAVSIAVFIGVYSFMELAFYATGVYFESSEYQLLAYTYDEDGYEKALQIAALEGVEQAEIRRIKYFAAGMGQEVPYTQEFREFQEQDEGEYAAFLVMSLGEEGYKRYCAKVGADVEKARDSAVVLAPFVTDGYVDGKRYHYEGEVARYKPGDIIGFEDRETGKQFRIPVLLQTDQKPMCMGGSVYNCVVLIVSDSLWESCCAGSGTRDTGVFIRCGDADTLEETIRREINLIDFQIYNYEASYRSSRSLYLVVALFLYGFIIVVSLIGVTNVFNTITTNMELRAPEFAVCRSVGMTGKEFRRMIWLEGLFYGGKSLLFGIPMGILISLAFHYTMGFGLEARYLFPLGGILIAAAAVFGLLFCIMRYSMGKINRRNIIATIQNENI